MLQFPLYVGMSAARTWTCLMAALGDVAIARGCLWRRLGRGTLGAVGAAPPGHVHGRVPGRGARGVIVAVEWVSVHRWRRWSYAGAMLLVLGVGLAPLVQWVAVPLLTLWLARRHIGVPRD